jgi:hypothetical protein
MPVTFTGPITVVNDPTAAPTIPPLPAILNIAAVTGVDGTGNNAASKADVDTAIAAIQLALNAVLLRLG